MNAIDLLEQKELTSKHPEFKAGDTVKVHVKIKEGEKERIQVYQGVVIKIHNRGIGTTFTVRKISFGIGVERVFPLHAPVIHKIEVVTRGKVRRAKLYYLRDLKGKKARIKPMEREFGARKREELKEEDVVKEAPAEEIASGEETKSE